MNKASTEYAHLRTNEPLETGMHQVHKCVSPSKSYVDFQVVLRTHIHILKLYPHCTAICNQCRHSLFSVQQLYPNGCAK